MGRRIVGTGFAGEMLDELEASCRCDYQAHLEQWVKLVMATGDRHIVREPSFAQAVAA